MMCSNLGRGVLSCVVLTSLSVAGIAQDQGGGKVDKLEKKVQSLESKIKDLEDKQETGQSELDVSLDEIDEQLLNMSMDASEASPGKRNFLLTGYARGNYTNAEGSPSNIGADLFPIFLWNVSDRIFVEGELELELEDGGTNAALEYAQMSYVIDDNMTLSMGRFLNPSNYFAANLHPAWINKLPDKPLAVGSGRIQAFTQVGVLLHGGMEVGSSNATYAIYASNGPSLKESGSSYGSLNDKNWPDSNNSKAIGGRFGYFPTSELEVGYSIEVAQVTDEGSSVADADATIQSLDFNYVSAGDGGTLEWRGQWVLSDVEDVVYDPSGSDFGPASYDNERSGGYVQAAYRPADGSVLGALEGVLRYEELDLPTGAPGALDRSRVTLGMNYWVGPSSVFKLAYQIDDKDSPGTNSDAVLLQWATGF